MPVVEVELIGEVASETRRGLAGRIADRVAAVLKSEPQSVWVRLKFVLASDYAENEGAEQGPPTKPSASPAHPVFVKILKHAWPAKDVMKHEARALAAAIGDACHRPAEEVHIVYEPPGGGRVAFGGSLLD